MNALNTVRKIRACEGEAAAQLLLEKFAEAAVLAERERCAKACENYWSAEPYDPERGLQESAARDCAATIRREVPDEAPE